MREGEGIVERARAKAAALSALRQGVTPGAAKRLPDIDPLTIGDDLEELAATIERLQAEVERLREELEHFVDIVDGTDETGFDPHVEQMLMDAAETARAALTATDEKATQ